MKNDHTVHKNDSRDKTYKVQSTTSQSGGDWKSGIWLTPEFYIERKIGAGGAGSVYLVKRKRDDRLFALKTLHYSLDKQALSQRLAFIEEIKTWIDLPNHPNINKCYFARLIRGRLCVFAEYVSGGSLANWLEKKIERDLYKIIKLMIQLCWGLEVAHTCGVVHKDIKPGNLLISEDNDLKITDFGLSKTKLKSSKNQFGKSIEMLTTDKSQHGFTLAYCSPEQYSGKKVDLRTDIWSLGLTFMHCLCGDVYWGMGPLANEVFKEFQKDPASYLLYPMTTEIIELLEKCFCLEPEKRWESAAILERKFRQIYDLVGGTSYTLKTPEVKFEISEPIEFSLDYESLMSQSMTNPFYWLARARSYRDHTEQPDNNLKIQRKGSSEARALEDLNILEKAQEIYESLLVEDMKSSSILKMELGNLLFAKSFVLLKIHDHEGALSILDSAENIFSDLDSDEMSRIFQLSQIYIAKSGIFWMKNMLESALRYSNLAIRLLGNKVDSQYQSKWENLKSRAYLNKAVYLRAFGQYQKSIDLYKKVIVIRKNLVEKMGMNELEDSLGRVYMNLGVVLIDCDRYEEAIDNFKRVIEIRTRNIGDRKHPGRLAGLANAYLNMAVCLKEAGKLQDSKDYSYKAIEIWRYLVDERGFTDYRSDLAQSLTNHANTLRDLKNYSKAKELYHKAMTIQKDLVSNLGHTDQIFNMVLTYTNFAENSIKLNLKREARQIAEDAIKCIEVYSDTMSPKNRKRILESRSRILAMLKEYD